MYIYIYDCICIHMPILVSMNFLKAEIPIAMLDSRRSCWINPSGERAENKKMG